MSFSDRIGKTKPKTLLQVDAMDDDLRNGLWEACIEHYLRHSRVQYELDAPFQDLIRGLYVNFFKRPTDTIPDGYYRNIGAIWDWFFKANWFDVYNFIEYLLQKDAGNFSKRISFFLEREKSAYRVINRQLVPITEPIEIAAVSAATLVPERFAGARVHMQTAIQLYSQKPEPDYRNAVKEAISAVETVAKVITGDPKATLGDALKKISEKMPLHPAMREAMTKLYGYTSDEGGIRHAMLEESKIDDAEAKFMIVACSAFVNLCVQRSSGLDH